MGGRAVRLLCREQGVPVLVFDIDPNFGARARNFRAALKFSRFTTLFPAKKETERENVRVTQSTTKPVAVCLTAHLRTVVEQERANRDRATPADQLLPASLLRSLHEGARRQPPHRSHSRMLAPPPRSPHTAPPCKMPTHLCTTRRKTAAHLLRHRWFAAWRAVWGCLPSERDEWYGRCPVPSRWRRPDTRPPACWLEGATTPNSNMHRGHPDSTPLALCSQLLHSPQW